MKVHICTSWTLKMCQQNRSEHPSVKGDFEPHFLHKICRWFSHSNSSTNERYAASFKPRWMSDVMIFTDSYSSLQLNSLPSHPLHHQTTVTSQKIRQVWFWWMQCFVFEELCVKIMICGKKTGLGFNYLIIFSTWLLEVCSCTDKGSSL